MQSVYSALVSANLINKSACTIIMATGCAVIARNNCLIGQRALNSINTTSGVKFCFVGDNRSGGTGCSSPCHI